jgi:protein TonB
MAYADQKMSTNKMVALVIVALLHVLVGYALVTGLAYSAIKKMKERVETFDVKEEKPPEEPPPPPPPQDQPAAPPIVAPPAMINVPTQANPVQTVPVAPPAAPVLPIAAPPAAAPAPAAPPPAPKFTAKGASPKGSPASWATSDDYPPKALREEREGTTRFRVSIGPDGRVTDCQVTGSSGSPDLDAAACANISRRARFNPAMDAQGNPTTGSYSNAIRWVIPR